MVQLVRSQFRFKVVRVHRVSGGRKVIWAGLRCAECGRVFDLADETDAAEWACGHDCEVPGMPDDNGGHSE